MVKSPKNDSFSLAETLIAVGILAVGMMFIAGVFPVAIRLTTIAAERTTAAIVAEEAFAKVKLYGGRGVVDFTALSETELKDFNTPTIFPGVDKIEGDEFTYPSVSAEVVQKQYYWSAICRLTEPYSAASNPNPPVQVIVFVCRKVGSGSRPVPVEVGVSKLTKDDELQINDPNEKSSINDDYTIIDDKTGQLYRVLKRYPTPNENTIQLDRNWQGDNSGDVWVVPPLIGGRYPCIAIYQQVIRFCHCMSVM